MSKVLKIGEKWSRISYGEITDINGRDVQVKNEKGESWWISEELIQKEFDLASCYETTEKVSQTAIGDLLLSNPGKVMTVNFNKKVDKKAAEEAVTNYIELVKRGEREDISVGTPKTLVNELLNGEERTITGRHYHSVDEFGRVQFIDMQLEKDDTKDYDTRLRKVDPRTINWIIIENVKYVKR